MSTKTAKEIVTAFIEALNSEDFETAQTYVTDDMRFEGVMGSREGSKAYFDDMKKMKLKYQLIKTFDNGDDVCLLYQMNMSGNDIFCCGWYHLHNGRISTLKVVFDPRPLLKKASKK